MVRVLKKNYRFSFVSGRITYVFERIREQLLSCWKNIYPCHIKPKKGHLAFILIIGGVDYLSKYQFLKPKLFKISQSAVEFDCFKLKYWSMQSYDINLKVVRCGAILKIIVWKVAFYLVKLRGKQQLS